MKTPGNWARPETWLENTLLIFFSAPCKIQGIFFAKKVVGHNFWTEGPTDLRLTFLSCIFDGLFGDTPLDHIFSHMPICPYAPNMPIMGSVGEQLLQSLSNWSIYAFFIQTSTYGPAVLNHEPFPYLSLPFSNLFPPFPNFSYSFLPYSTFTYRSFSFSAFPNLPPPFPTFPAFPYLSRSPWPFLPFLLPFPALPDLSYPFPTFSRSLRPYGLKVFGNRKITKSLE